VYHLLLNAVQYSKGLKPSEPARITIKATIERHNRLHIDISDTGIGIVSDERGHLFEPFYRSSRVAHSVGIGLGLTIARKNCSLLNGKIALLHSVEEQGSTFRITLPLY
jgi:signal transduction histidine kinase